MLLLLLSLFPVSTFNVITMKLFFITYNFRFQFTIFIIWGENLFILLNGKRVSSKVDFLRATKAIWEEKSWLYERSAWSYYFRRDKKLPPEYFKRVFEKTTPVTELLFKFTETYIRSLTFFFYFYLNFNFISSPEP